METSTALLIIDVQKGFINSYTQQIPSLITDIQNDPQYKVICATQFINKQESPFVNWLGWSRFMSNTKEDIDFAFTPQHTTALFQKNTYNSLTKELRAFLENHHINKIHMCGLDTNMCVLTTATTLFEEGQYEPFVLSQYCASHSGPDYHDAGLKLLEKAIGQTHII